LAVARLDAAAIVGIIAAIVERTITATVPVAVVLAGAGNDAAFSTVAIGISTFAFARCTLTIRGTGGAEIQ